MAWEEGEGQRRCRVQIFAWSKKAFWKSGFSVLEKAAWQAELFFSEMLEQEELFVK